MQDLSLYLLDLVQNSLRAGCTKVHISLNFGSNCLTLTVQDNGCGMNEEQSRQALSPFYTTRMERTVGLGLPLFRMACEQTGGSFSLFSQEGKGTTVVGKFCTNQIDCPPLGKIGDTMAVLISGNEAVQFYLEASRGTNRFQFDTQQVKEILHDVPIRTSEVVIFLSQYIEEQTQIIRGGVMENEKSC